MTVYYHRQTLNKVSVQEMMRTWLLYLSQMFINESADVPYEAILYLTGECNYGGRVTDDWDRRTLTTILEDFVNEQVVTSPSYLFCRVSEVYGLPRKTEYQVYIQHIETLPPDPPPEVFGLNMNAGITRDLFNSRVLIDTMLLVQGGTVSAGGAGEKGAGDTLLSDITDDILGKLPVNYDLEKAMCNYPTSYSESMNTVLVQEMDRFNRLLSVIRSTLETLRRAVDGLVVMSPELEALAGSLLVNKVPAMWAARSYPSLKTLASYVVDFLDRLRALQVTLPCGGLPVQAEGPSGRIPKKARIISSSLSSHSLVGPTLGDPASQLSRVVTRALKWLTAQMSRPRPTGPESQEPGPKGPNPTTLSLLAEQLPKVLWDSLPLIWMKPCEKTRLKEGARYKSPLYKTSERRGILSTTGHSTNYVLPILLGTDRPVAHWIKRGVALLCQLDD
uniref:Dynein heavy chain n=1 Tax=Timema genevievae TaxID=629358 RepID=A0A7R9JTQ4_TIMGE|nr:unnamed protein product [Timema genevievae]